MPPDPGANGAGAGADGNVNGILRLSVHSNPRLYMRDATGHRRGGVSHLSSAAARPHPIAERASNGDEQKLRTGPNTIGCCLWEMFFALMDWRLGDMALDGKKWILVENAQEIYFGMQYHCFAET